MSEISELLDGDGPHPDPRVLEPTAPYPDGAHPLQVRIETCSERLTAEPRMLAHLEFQQRLEAAEELQAVLAAIRWIHYDAAAMIPAERFDLAGQSAAHLQHAIELFVEFLEQHLDRPTTNRSVAARIERFLSSLPAIAAWYREMAPLRFLTLHDDSLTRAAIGNARNEIEEELDQVATHVRASLATINSQVEQVRSSQADYTALLSDLDEQHDRIEDQLRANATAALQGNYAGVAKEARRSRNYALGMLVAVAIFGALVLGVVFDYWHEQYGAGSGSPEISGNELAVLLSLKVPLVIAWLWLFRLVTRQLSAATHRRAIAQAKEAALQTWESLAGTSDESRNLVLPLIADHVLDPTKTGILDDHRDGMTVGANRLQFGDPK